VDIYVTGWPAVLWKNGVEQVLGYGEAHSVYVSDSDVYVAGFDSFAGVPTPTLWKNGVATRIGNGKGMARSVFVSDGDVYVAGTDNGTRNDIIGFATLWKNGIPRYEATYDSIANSVFVSGENTYVAGTAYNGWASYPQLWINNTTQGFGYSTTGSASSVTVSGGDVYLAGTYGGRATLWKNSIPQYLGDLGSRASSVFISDGDVYVAGSSGYMLEEENLRYRATIWKNGIVQYLGVILGRGRNDHVSSVFVLDGVVYAAGVTGLPGRATLWINGEARLLDSLTEAYSIYVRLR
jgi:hypothetical protein